jgi:hypothetical protein
MPNDCTELPLLMVSNQCTVSSTSGIPYMVKRSRKGFNGSLQKSLAGLAAKARSRKGRNARKNTRNIPIAKVLPTPKPYWSLSTKGKNCLVTGSDWSQAVIVRQSNDKEGAVLLDIPINPYTMGCSRLQHIAQMYEFYTVKQLRFSFHGSMPTTTNGLLCGYIDYDVDDDLTAQSINVANLKLAHSHESFADVKPYDKQYWVWNDFDNVRLQRLYANPMQSDTQSHAGRFFLLTEVPVGVATDTSIGSLYMEYTIEFHDPQMDDNLYGFANKYKGGATQTSTNPFGTDATQTWNNLPMAKVYTNTTFTVFPGNYSFFYYTSSGTSLAAMNFTAPAATTTTVFSNSFPNAAATSLFLEAHFTASAVSIITVTGNGGTYSAANTWWMLVSLPYDGTSIGSYMVQAKKAVSTLVREVCHAQNSWEELEMKQNGQFVDVRTNYLKKEEEKSPSEEETPINKIICPKIKRGNL